MSDYAGKDIKDYINIEDADKPGFIKAEFIPIPHLRGAYTVSLEVENVTNDMKLTTISQLLTDVPVEDVMKVEGACRRILGTEGKPN